jgi:choline transport protein
LLTKFAGIVHVVALVAIVVVLAVMAPKNTAKFVFTETSNQSGWSSDGVSWLVGLLSTVYPFLGYDAACHLAEELPNASRNVPLAMLGSVTINGVMGLGYCVILLFSSGPLDALLSTSTGFPFMQIFLDATKSPAGTTILSLTIIFTAIAATAAGITSTSRTVWAFARDKATPFDFYLSKIDEKHQIPVRAVVVITLMQGVLGFLYLGNTTAFNAILSMAILGMYTSYLLPIVYMLVFGRKKLQLFEYGPFSLGKVLGVALNCISIGWLVVAIVFSTFPTAMPVTAQNMNYSTVVMGGWLLFGTGYYIIWGRYNFEVPAVDHIVSVPIGGKA